jgi:hypothetical protein
MKDLDIQSSALVTSHERRCSHRRNKAADYPRSLPESERRIVAK